MSDIPAPDLNIREQIVRIDRAIAEMGKFLEETQKLRKEATKLEAETRKLTWDRWLAPALAIAAVFGGVLGVATFIAHLMGH